MMLNGMRISTRALKTKDEHDEYIARKKGLGK
jgi:hypothetical protein